MSDKTRIIQLTAVRSYVGQHTIELPIYCRNDRFRALVMHGGATTRLVAARMNFGRIQGTGLAHPIVSNGETVTPDFPLADLSAVMREDGFIF